MLYRCSHANLSSHLMKMTFYNFDNVESTGLLNIEVGDEIIFYQ